MSKVLKSYTVFGVYDDTDERYADFIKADSPEDAEKKVNKAHPTVVIAGVVEGEVHPVDGASPLGVTPLKGRGYETKVMALHAVVHKIRLPFSCPNCDQNLRASNTVQQLDWIEQASIGRIPRTAPLHEWGVDRNLDRKPIPGPDKPLRAVGLWCLSCGQALWNGLTRTKEV